MTLLPLPSDIVEVTRIDGHQMNENVCSYTVYTKGCSIQVD